MDVQIKYSTMIVNDMEESIKFYRDVLGFEVDSTFVTKPKGAPEGNITLMKTAKGDTMVELIKDNVHDAGYYSIGMVVDDIDKAVEELQAKGINDIQGPFPISNGRIAFIDDPNGVRICLIYHNS